MDTELVVFDYAVLRQLYDERPVYERFGRLVAEYLLLGTDARLVEHLLLTPEERYRALLRSGKTKILELIPQHLVANYLGITPVSLSRIRARVARALSWPRVFLSFFYRRAAGKRGTFGYSLSPLFPTAP